MSIDILLIGTPGAHQTLVTALEYGLHDVHEIAPTKGFDLNYIQKYSSLILCLDDLEITEVKNFVTQLKNHITLQHLPIFAYSLHKETVHDHNLIDIPFDDLFHPRTQQEYAHISPKITGIYRRLQISQTIQTKNDLLGIEEAQTILQPHRIGVLSADPDLCNMGSTPAIPLLKIDYSTQIADFEKRLENTHFDIVIIDTSIGIAALKLASRLITHAQKRYPVIVIIPEDQPQLAMQCIEMRAHDFIVLPIIPNILRLKIVTVLHWIQRDSLNKKSIDQQLDLSIRDELTKLYNRRYINRVIERMIDQAYSPKDFFSLCMIDVDHFKKLNDTYGHQVGDNILRQLANKMSLHVRLNDNVGRWGGEEFIIVFAAVNQELGVFLAERIRKLIADFDFFIPELNTTLNITISIGIAHHRIGENLNQLVTRADRAMYNSKELGRNRVSEDTDESPETLL